MTRLLHRHRADEALIPVAALPARTVAPVRPEPGIADQVLFDLRADDARNADFAAARALLAVPMRDPAVDSQPIGALLDRARHVCRSRDLAFEAAMAEDREASAERCADLAAATWVDEAVGRLITEKALFVLDAVAARPELRHDTALLMALAPVVAMLKGSVA